MATAVFSPQRRSNFRHLLGPATGTASPSFFGYLSAVGLATSITSSICATTRSASSETCARLSGNMDGETATAQSRLRMAAKSASGGRVCSPRISLNAGCSRMSAIVASPGTPDAMASAILCDGNRKQVKITTGVPNGNAGEQGKPRNQNVLKSKFHFEPNPENTHGDFSVDTPSSRRRVSGQSGH